MKTLAITGAAGVVGTGLRAQLLARGYSLVLLDLLPIPDCAANERAVQLDITDQAALTEQLRGCDALLHLAACTSDAPWPEQVRLSVQGCISAFDAARAAGLRRVVYASSHHVVGLHPRPPLGPVLDVTAPLRPDSRYGVGKAFGESIATLYACKYDMQVLMMRIGNANSEPLDRRRMGNWISWRDLAQLVSIGVEHPDLMCSTVYAISDTTERHYDNRAAYALGYRPQDGTAAAEHEERILRTDPVPAPGSAAAFEAGELTLGGQLFAAGFVGDARRLLSAEYARAAGAAIAPADGG